MMNKQEEEQWLSYINLLAHHELHALNQFYLKGRNLQKVQLARALFQLLQRDEFLDKMASELDFLDRKILASVYSRPCDFFTLKERLSSLLNPVKLGMRLAVLRSKLLLLSTSKEYWVFERVAQKLQLSFFDIVGYEKTPEPELESQAPWLNENLLLAAASTLLSQRRTQRSSFANLFEGKKGEKRWQLVLQVLTTSGILEYSEGVYRPCLAYRSLLGVSVEQRLWYYWSITLKLTSEELYNLLTPLIALSSFSEKAWFNWLKHLFPITDSTLTEKMIILDLLEHNNGTFRVNPKLTSAPSEQDKNLQVTATGEFHLRYAKLESAPLILASALKSYNVVSLYKLELPLVKKIWQIYQSNNSFDLWCDDLEKRGINLEESLHQQLQLLYQDSQKLLFFPEATVLCCESNEQEVISNLPGFKDYIIHQQPGVMILDPKHRVWLQTLNEAGFDFFTKTVSKTEPRYADAKLPSLWPPANPIKIGLKIPEQQASSASEMQLRKLQTASGLNYNAKRQILISVISKQHHLVKVKMLPPDERELLLLPLQIYKENDGSSRIKAFNIDTAETLQLNIGKLATVSELCIALIDEPLGHYLSGK